MLKNKSKRKSKYLKWKRHKGWEGEILYRFDKKKSWGDFSSI